ncbi:MAG TPA: IclR family transcriptional regulator [Ramlibacter sp.]|nr:IclR family transcriptional regulator [Ramlibacter sp.]
MSKKDDIDSRVPIGFEEYAGDRQFATTLARGLELLRCFTHDQPVLGNGDFARQLGLPPATVSRLTYTLTCMGYLAPAEASGKYQLGSAMLSLSYPLLAQFRIRRTARPLMLEFAERVGGSVAIAIRDRLAMVYIEAIYPKQRIYTPDVGSRHSLAGSAVGRAWMMACRPAEREAILNQLRLREPAQWKRYGPGLKENIARFAHDGCCVSVGEVVPDVQAVSVPLGRVDRGELAAIGCAFQGRPLDADWLRKEIAPQLSALARQIA